MYVSEKIPNLAVISISSSHSHHTKLTENHLKQYFALWLELWCKTGDILSFFSSKSLHLSQKPLTNTRLVCTHLNALAYWIKIWQWDFFFGGGEIGLEKFHTLSALDISKFSILRTDQMLLWRLKWHINAFAVNFALYPSSKFYNTQRAWQPLSWGCMVCHFTITEAFILQI